MADLGALKDKVDQLRRKAVGLEIGAARLKSAMEKAHDDLAAAGIDSAKNIDAQLSALHAQAVVAHDTVASLVEELDARLS